jgi:hypothetical protein
MRSFIHKYFVAGVFFLFSAFPGYPAGVTAFRAGEYLQVVGLIHLDSTVSGGDNTPEMIAAVARNAGAEVGIITDHDTQRVTYGISPLRNIAKISHSRASIRTYGVSRYLGEIADINAHTKDFLLIPGIEAVPYYHWIRDPGGTLALADLHRHILVAGLDSAKSISHLPSIETGYPPKYTRMSLAGLLWLVPFLLALFVVTLPREDSSFDSRLESFVRSRAMRVLGYGALLISIVFLANAYPFGEPEVNQYDPDAKAAPYQQVIDYVNDRNGVTFWAHPEAEYDEEVSTAKEFLLFGNVLKRFNSGGIRVRTKPYYFLLNDTENYTGFSIFAEGYKVVGKPGGLWDFILMQFCMGRRERPVWAISELDLDKGTSPEIAAESQTVFLVREKNERACLDALRNGRMYCFTHFMSQRLTIRDWSVVSGSTIAVSGEAAPFEPDATLRFDLEMRGEPVDLDVIVLADGVVIARKRIHGSERIELPVPEPDSRLGYVRVVVEDHGEPAAATNPIFLERGDRM